MAMTTMTLTCKTRWWVWPYLWLAIAAAWTVAPFASEGQIEVWSEAQAAFIVKHGMRIGVK